MKRKILFITMAVLLLTLLIVGVASAKGWVYWYLHPGNNVHCFQYHWASDHRVMIRSGICEDGVMIDGIFDELFLDGAKFDPLKAEEYCGDDAIAGLGAPYSVPMDIYGRPDLTFEGYVDCRYPPGHWD